MSGEAATHWHAPGQSTQVVQVMFVLDVTQSMASEIVGVKQSIKEFNSAIREQQVRAAIDAVVADAYGLGRDQYGHALSPFSPASYPKAAQLRLAKFDELKRLGLDAFTRKYDPYHDIPLNERLPQPVIDLPAPEKLKKPEQGRLF